MMGGRIYYVLSEERMNYLLSQQKQQIESTQPQKEQEGEGLLYLLPPRQQKKGKKLLDVLQQLSSFMIYPNGSFAYKQKHVASSHIVDLVSAAVQTGFRKKHNFTGLKEFVEAVKDSNAPRSLLSREFIELLDVVT